MQIHVGLFVNYFKTLSHQTFMIEIEMACLNTDI